MSPRHPCARTRGGYTTLSVVSCRRHGPDPRLAARVPPVVGARPTPSARVPRSYGYAFGASRPGLRPGALWGRGIPGTRAIARVAARCTSSTAF
jgi:hypothetical protein